VRMNLFVVKYKHRRISLLCAEGRIEGVIKRGNGWLGTVCRVVNNSGGVPVGVADSMSRLQIDLIECLWIALYNVKRHYRERKVPEHPPSQSRALEPVV
ncbi:MAG: hypothetical protein K6F35_02280, partial [Lachnospiraceae bacterium]|nr:hypothetical protein [Lachnospiraceae bacterium]